MLSMPESSWGSNIPGQILRTKRCILRSVYVILFLNLVLNNRITMGISKIFNNYILLLNGCSYPNICWS